MKNVLLIALLLLLAGTISLSGCNKPGAEQPAADKAAQLTTGTPAVNAEVAPAVPAKAK